MDAEQVVTKYSDMIYGITFRYMGNKEDAEDAYSETFLSYFKKERTFESEEHRKAWLIRVAINCCKKILLSKQYPDDIDEVEVADEERPYSKDEVMDLREAIEKLKPEYKEVILLFYINDMTVKQIADTIDENENVVKLRLSRARKKLKEFLGEEELS